MSFNPQSREKLGPYWAALGEFAYYYGWLEFAMLRTLVFYTGTPEPTAQAVYSGVRLRQAISFVRRTAEAKGEELPPELEEAFTKMATITDARDRLLHHGLQFEDPEGDSAFISDERRNLPTRARREAITPKDIHDLAADTIVCWARLVVFNSDFKSHPTPFLEGWRDAAKNRPWRYKSASPSPAKQAPRPKKPRARPQKA